VHDVLEDIAAWYDAGERFALATVVRTWRSAPRQPGAALAVGPDGTVVGSVSGGCVEGAVYELAQEVLRTGVPVLETYGVSDDDAFSVGLTCGGVLDVFVEAVDRTTHPQLADVVASVRAREPVSVATVAAGPGRLGEHLVVRPGAVSGSLGSQRLDDAVAADALGMLNHGTTGLLHLGPDGERRLDDLSVFVQSFAPPPRMLVFGAIDFAAAVVRVGRFLGYAVIVCDARPVFATARRFPDADEVVVDWPHRYLARTVVDERTVICVLTHDPKFDVPLLTAALRTPAAYIGAMGSRRTHDQRLDALREAGLTRDELARLSSPIGLDIGGRTPEETAVSIAAEITAIRWGGTGRRLRDIDRAIHP
jgi:xanthine dehydrogenase accessory factor